MQNSIWYIIVNPTASNGRAGRSREAIAELLTRAGYTYKMVDTTHSGHATKLAIEGIQQGFSKIMAVGGDGVNNEVINGIFKQTYRPPSDITYTLIPMGTGNDWARTYNLPTDFRRLIPKLKTAQRVRQDIGLATFQNADGETDTRYFVNVAGLAYDGYLCKKMSITKTFTHPLGFLWFTLKELFNYTLRPARIRFDHQVVENRFYTINIGICPYSGGGMQLVPHAIPDDGLLALTIAGPMSKLSVLLNTWRFYTGKVAGAKLVDCFQTKEVIVETVDNEPTDIEVDGEYIGTTPARFTIVEKGLMVLKM